MKQKKSGFTLVEILVVIAISAIVLTMVGTTMVFMTQMTGDILQEAEDIDMAKNIEKYLRNFSQDQISEIVEQEYTQGNETKFGIFLIDENGNLKQEGKIIFSDTGLTSFIVDKKDADKDSVYDFIFCKMQFDSGKEFEFILAPIKQEVK